MASQLRIPTGSPEVDSYLALRLRTRFLRRYGGPLLAIFFSVAAVALLWQMLHRGAPDLEQRGKPAGSAAASRKLFADQK